MKYSAPTITSKSSLQNYVDSQPFQVKKIKRRSKTLTLAMRDVAQKMRNYNKVNLYWDEDIDQIMKWGKLNKVQACLLAQIVTIFLDSNALYATFADFTKYLSTNPSNYLG